MKANISLIVVMAILVLLLAAFFFLNPSMKKTDSNISSNEDQNNSNNSQGSTLPTSSDQYDVGITGFAFSPAILNIKAGDTVIWTNKDAAPHTVTSDSGSELASLDLPTAGAYSHTFMKAGTYSYHCKIHSGMKAQIIVS